MVYHSTSFLCLFFLLCTCLSGQVDNSTKTVQEMPDHLKETRTEKYKDQLEKYLQQWIIDDRMEIEVFEGGHEARVGTGIPFLKRWLMP